MQLGDLKNHIYPNFPMKYATALGVGGPADYLLRPSKKEHIQLGLQLAHIYNLPVTLIGYGTNLLVTDKGIRGLVIQLADTFAQASITNNTLTASAGCLFGSVSKLAAHHCLSGLEFAVGIPGSLGGAVFMNAGAYDGEVGPLVKQVTWVTADQIGVWQNSDYQYSYRYSNVQDQGVVVADTTLELVPGIKTEILAKMEDFQEKRRTRQPLEYPSAGSTFKRPPDHYVGPMIEALSLKGYQIGGAKISTKHAGFIINCGGATAADILSLIKHVQVNVKAKFGLDLEPEVRIIGEQ